MPFVWILGLIIVVIVSGLIGSGTNDIAKVAAVIFFPSVIALYFSPTIVAFNRGHQNRTPIALLNFFLGWTFLGWVGALIWAHGAKQNAIQAPGYIKETGRRCFEEAAGRPPADPPNMLAPSMST